jgi:hypothetical protein
MSALRPQSHINPLAARKNMISSYEIALILAIFGALKLSATLKSNK